MKELILVVIVTNRIVPLDHTKLNIITEWKHFKNFCYLKIIISFNLGIRTSLMTVVPLLPCTISSSNAGHTSGCRDTVPFSFVFGRNTICVIAYDREMRNM